jgi:hypothetical protein
MQSYSHLSDDERDQIGILRAAGRWMGCPGAPSSEPRSPGSCSERTSSDGYSPLDAAGAYQLLRRGHPNEKPLYVYLWGIGSARDGRPNRSPVG